VHSGPDALRTLMQADLERYRSIGRRIHISLDSRFRLVAVGTGRRPLG